jgi:citrate lyase subunit beta/citryl-CoA lyase
MRLRSLLFVPCDRPERMEKAMRSAADAVILDLEDSVAPDQKAAARIALAEFLNGSPKPKPVFVRVNPLSSGLTRDDLRALAGSSVAGLILPKAEGRRSVECLNGLTDEAELGPTPILPIATETAVAMFELGSYREVAALLVGLTWGAEDLPAAIGAATSKEPDGSFTPPYEFARSLTLFAAHACGVPALETVYPDFKDLDGLNRFAARAARDGFTGMMAIHPSQLEVINAAFTPAPEALARAQKIVDAFAQNPGMGALALDGAMVDAPHLNQAQRLLGRAAG